jgi:hypothetical protein
MLPTKETQHVATAQALLIDQFKSKTVIQGYLNTLARRVQEIENVLWDIIELRRLDVATGIQLDSLGKLVGEKRIGRSDVDYRTGIRLRIRVNRSKGRIVDVIDVAILASGAVVPRVTEYAFLGFQVEIYGQTGERYIADLLSRTRAATSYGVLVASDLAASALLVFDDAVVPGAGIETFSDAVSGTGKLCASAYGLPSDFTGIVLGAGVAPVVSSLNKSALTRTQGGILLTITGTGFTGATGVTFGGTAAASVVVVNDTTLTCITPAKAAGTHAVIVTGPGGSSSGSVTCKFVDPTSIFAANLKRWYSQTYAAGAWTDASGAANTVQATAGKRPTATTLAGTTDRPATHVALQFDGVDDGLQAAATATPIFTTAGVVACVAKVPAVVAATENNLVAQNFGGESYILGLRSAATGKAFFGVGGSTNTEAAISAANIDNDTPCRLIGTYGANVVRLYVDGSAQADTGAGIDPSGVGGDLPSIGSAMSSGAATAYHALAKIAEVVIADVLPSTTQRNELDAYLRDCAGQAA